MMFIWYVCRVDVNKDGMISKEEFFEKAGVLFWQVLRLSWSGISRLRGLSAYNMHLDFFSLWVCYHSTYSIFRLFSLTHMFFFPFFLCLDQENMNNCIILRIKCLHLFWDMGLVSVRFSQKWCHDINGTSERERRRSFYTSHVSVLNEAHIGRVSPITYTHKKNIRPVNQKERRYRTNYSEYGIEKIEQQLQNPAIQTKGHRKCNTVQERTRIWIV